MDNVVREYDYYTLEQARKIIYQEMRHDRITRKRRIAQNKLEKRKKKIQYVKEQIKFTLFLFVMFILIPFGMFVHWLHFGY